MPKLATVVDVLGKLENTFIATHPERCAMVRNRNSKCTKCADACTTGAISIIDGDLSITPDLCIGCGTCSTVCPTSALEAIKPNDAELAQRGIMASKATEGRPVFACSKALKKKKFDKGKVSEVVCIGRLEEVALVGLASIGAQTIYLVGCEDCETCENCKGFETACMVRDSANGLIKAWGAEPVVEIVRELPEFALEIEKDSEAVDGMSRRDLFTQLKEEAKASVGEAVSNKIGGELNEEEEPVKFAKVTKDGTLPHFIPSRRERLLDNLDRLGDPIEDNIKTRLWGSISINETLCQSCRMCAVFCPTGAIAKYDDKKSNTFGIEHRPSDCVQCHLCEDICHWGALKVTDEVNTDVLLSGATERYEMAPRKVQVNKPDTIVRTMYQLLGGGQIYER